MFFRNRVGHPMTDDENEPVHLVEDVETGDRFLVYGTDKGLRLAWSSRWSPTRRRAHPSDKTMGTIARNRSTIGDSLARPYSNSTTPRSMTVE